MPTKKKKPTLRQPELSRETIRHTAGKLLSTGQWVETFGKPYYCITRTQQLVELCNSEGRRALPPGWHSHKRGRKHYLFYHPSPPQPSTTWRPALGRNERAIVERAIKRSCSKGLRRGEQKELAARLGISESQMSRLLRGERQLQKAGARRQTAPYHKLRTHRAAPATVASVFERLLTLKEWRDHVARPNYGISDLTYISDMCSNRPATAHAKTPARLPAGWHSVRAGESWLVYAEDLTPRRRLIKQHAPHAAETAKAAAK